MNLIEVAGFLGADAEERFTSSGKRIIELRIAARVKQGNKDETLWWRATVWDDRLDKMLPYLKKGTALIIFGEMLIPEVYVAKDGTHKISLTMRAEIVKFSPFGKPEREKGTSYAPAGTKQIVEEGQGQEMAYSGYSSGNEGFTGDDLPF